MLTIAEGNNSITINITEINDDNIAEGEETLAIDLELTSTVIPGVTLNLVE